MFVTLSIKSELVFQTSYTFQFFCFDKSLFLSVCDNIILSIDTKNLTVVMAYSMLEEMHTKNSKPVHYYPEDSVISYVHSTGTNFNL